MQCTEDEGHKTSNKHQHYEKTKKLDKFIDNLLLMPRFHLNISFSRRVCIKVRVFAVLSLVVITKHSANILLPLKSG